MLKIIDSVRETTTTTGTGTITLDGAVTGYQSFGGLVGFDTYYTIESTNGAEVEVGKGTVSAGQLTRSVVYYSTNSNALVNFSAGTKYVYCCISATASAMIGTGAFWQLPSTDGTAGQVFSTDGAGGVELVDVVPATTGELVTWNGTIWEATGVTASNGALTTNGSLKVDHPTYTGLLTATITGNNTYSFTGDGIGTFLVAGSGGNVVDTQGQRLDSLMRGATFSNSLGGAAVTVNSAYTSSATSIIKAVASQTGNLTEWQNSSGTVLAAITPDGNISGGAHTLKISAGNNQALQLLNGTNSYIQWLNGSMLLSYAGNVTIGNGTNTMTMTTGNQFKFSSNCTFEGAQSGATKAVFKGVTGQTANLTEWQNSPGTVLACVDKSGNVGIGTSNPLYGLDVRGKSVNFGATSDADVTTGVTRFHVTPMDNTQGNYFSVYQRNSINNVIQSAITVPASTEGLVTVRNTTWNAGGQMSVPGRVHITNNATSTIPLVVRAIVSQAANLAEWQSSSGTALASISPNGTLTVGTSTLIANTTNDRVSLGTTSANGVLNIGGDRQLSFVGGNAGIDASTNIITVTAGLLNLSTGDVRINGFDAGAHLNIQANATAKRPLVVRAAAGQTASLTDWQDSAGTALASVSASGAVTAANFRGTLASVAANHTVTTETTIFADATAETVFITLPAHAAGRQVQVKKTDSSANAVRVTPASGTIDGDAWEDINSRYDKFTCVSDGTNWWTV